MFRSSPKTDETFLTGPAIQTKLSQRRGLISTKTSRTRTRRFFPKTATDRLLSLICISFQVIIILIILVNYVNYYNRTTERVSAGNNFPEKTMIYDDSELSATSPSSSLAAVDPISSTDSLQKIIVVGLPKSGTTSLYQYFDCSGYVTAHYCCDCNDNEREENNNHEEKSNHLRKNEKTTTNTKTKSMTPMIEYPCTGGKQISDQLQDNLRRIQTLHTNNNANNGHQPISSPTMQNHFWSGMKHVQVHTQLDGEIWKVSSGTNTTTGGVSNDGLKNNSKGKVKGNDKYYFLPQHYLLEILDHSAPNAIWILPLRNPMNWKSSVEKWIDMADRFKNEYRLQHQQFQYEQQIQQQEQQQESEHQNQNDNQHSIVSDRHVHDNQTTKTNPVHHHHFYKKLFDDDMARNQSFRQLPLLSVDDDDFLINFYNSHTQMIRQYCQKVRKQRIGMFSGNMPCIEIDIDNPNVGTILQKHFPKSKSDCWSRYNSGPFFFSISN